MTPTFSDPADIDLPIGTWFWHVHHTTLCEPLTEPLVNRLDYIRKHKPESEQAIRLALISPVKGTIPAAYVKARVALDKAGAAFVKARVALDKAGAAYVKAGVAYDKAWVALDKAWAAARPELETLHAIEHPDCPWNGWTIFPGGTA